MVDPQLLGSKGNFSSTNLIRFHFGGRQPRFTQHLSLLPSIQMGNKCPGCRAKAHYPLGEEYECVCVCSVLWQYVWYVIHGMCFVWCVCGMCGGMCVCVCAWCVVRRVWRRKSPGRSLVCLQSLSLTLHIVSSLSSNSTFSQFSLSSNYLVSQKWKAGSVNLFWE